MKTVTEFSGFQLRTMLDKKKDLIQQLRTHPKPAPTAVETAVTPADEVQDQAPAVEASTPEEVVVAAPEAVAPEDSAPPATPQPVVSVGKGPSKGKESAHLDEAIKEEFQKFVVETYKFEGQKLEFLWTAIQSVDRFKVSDLKRVVVLAPSAATEGEAASSPAQAIPKGAIQAHGHFFLVEYLPSLEKPKPRKFDRDGKRPGGRSGKGRGGKGGGRNDRGGENRRDPRDSRSPHNPKNVRGPQGRPGAGAAPRPNVAVAPVGSAVKAATQPPKP